MTEFTFYLSDDDTARLWALKEEARERNLTGNEYAAQLLAQALRQLYPEPVRYNENGRLYREKGGRPMQTLSFVNQKGGVGKTTSCLNVGAGLSRAGKRVLLIDADPQGNLTISAGVKLGDDTPTVYDVLKGSVDINAAIVPGDYDLLPADIMLSGADIELAAYRAGK